MAVVNWDCFPGFGKNDLFDLRKLVFALRAVDYEC